MWWRATWARLMVGCLAAGLFLWLAAREVQWEQAYASMRLMDSATWVAAWSAWVLALLFRMLGWNVLIREKVSISHPRLFAYSMVGAAANNLLPWKIGELIKSQLVRHDPSRLSWLASAGVLLVQTLLEAAVLLLSLLILLVTCDAGLLLPTWLPPATAGLLAVVTTGLVMLTLVPGWTQGMTSRLANALPTSLGAALRRGVQQLLEGAATLRSRTCFGGAALYSALHWAGRWLFFWWTLSALAIPVDPLMAMLTMSAVALCFLVPSAPSSLGTYHFAVVTVLSAFGVPADRALAAAVALHLGELLIEVALGSASLVMLGGFKPVRLAAAQGTAESINGPAAPPTRKGHTP